MINNIQQRNKELSTAVFVDYECWRFALYNQHGLETDIMEWFNDVKTHGRIDELHFFGDFNNELLSKDMPKLRTLTNDIIDCSNPVSTKDYTDFIILDRIYQCVMKNDNIQQYIIFSGDGHFSSVVAFLKNFKDKIVGIYAVDGTLNPQLRDSATWCQFVSIPEVNHTKETKLLLENLRWAESQDGLYPTFAKTISTVSKRSNDISQESVTVALKHLIEQGYVKQENKPIGDGKEIRVLIPDWDLLIRHRLWDPVA